ncbi:MAG: tetratricopeptide repeat protein [Flavobacteriales bacterium]|nr:tetratricopeptide repeat protein [Flavobacteriales bacterium]
MNKIPALILVIFLAGCSKNKDGLKKQILLIENSDSSSSKTSLNQLSELYLEYANSFKEDSMSEVYLYKSVIFKFLIADWDKSIENARTYMERYKVGDNLFRIYLKVGDIYANEKKNYDSAVRYYLKASGKIDFSTPEYRFAAKSLEEWNRLNTGSKKVAEYSYESARFYQMAGEFNAAVDNYLRFASEWKANEKAPDALSAAGFIYWNNLKEPEKAKECYTKIVDLYPESKLAVEAKMILEENLIEMDEMQLLEYISSKEKRSEPNQ